MTDLSNLSNEQLQALYQQQSPAQPAAPDPSKMSDDELKAAYSGQTKKPFTIYDTWPARLAKSVYSGLTLPGDVYNQKAQIPSHEGRVPGSVPYGDENSAGERVADLAGIVSPSVPRATPAMLPTSAEIKNAGKAGFEGTRAAEADINPRAVSHLSDIFTGELQQRGFTPENAPETFSTLGKLLNPPEGSVVTIPDLHSVRQTLGKAAQNFQNPREQAAASQTIQWLDRYLSNIPENNVLAGDPKALGQSLREAIGNYAAAAKSDQVTGALEAAELRSAAANSGLNQGNATRQRMASILLSDEKKSGFKPDELAQMETVVRGTMPGNAARYLSKILGGGGGMGQVAASAAGGTAGAFAGGPIGATIGATAVPLAGNALRMVSDASTQRQARILDEMIRGRSPLAKETMQEGGPSFVEQQRAQALARILMLSNQPAHSGN